MYQGRRVSVIIAAAGSGRRMRVGVPKQFMEAGGRPVIVRTAEIFEKNAFVDDIYIVTAKEHIARCASILRRGAGNPKLAGILAGGERRQDSVYAGIAALPEQSDIVLVHDAARPFVTDRVIGAVIALAAERGAAAAAVPVKDTIKEEKGGVFTATLDRGGLRAVQTPQGFRKEILTQAYELAFRDGFWGADDAVLVERSGEKVYYAEGDYCNIKLTTPEDRVFSRAIMDEQDSRGKIREGREEDEAKILSGLRVGNGYDAHRFAEGRKLILNGVEIPHDMGLAGHSDADVPVHALMDAMLGAAALGDIGCHFPDSDMAYKGISSVILLEKVSALLEERGFALLNADITVIAEKPKLAPYIEAMRKRLAESLRIHAERISVKATTSEGMGFTGRGEGVAAQAAVIVFKRGQSGREALLPPDTENES